MTLKVSFFMELENLEIVNKRYFKISQVSNISAVSKMSNDILDQVLVKLNSILSTKLNLDMSYQHDNKNHILFNYSYSSYEELKEIAEKLFLFFCEELEALHRKTKMIKTIDNFCRVNLETDFRDHTDIKILFFNDLIKFKSHSNCSIFETNILQFDSDLKWSEIVDKNDNEKDTISYKRYQYTCIASNSKVYIIRDLIKDMATVILSIYSCKKIEHDWDDSVGRY